MNIRKKLLWIILIIVLVISFLGIWITYNNELDAIDQKIQQLSQVSFQKE